MPKFYEGWTAKEILALVLRGIERGKIDDQTIINTATDAEEGDMAPLSEILRHAIKI